MKPRQIASIARAHLDGRIEMRSRIRVCACPFRKTGFHFSGTCARTRHDHPRQDSDRRFRLAGDAADRAARARGGGLFRDRAVPEGAGGVRRHAPEGGDSLGRPGLGARARRAAAAARALPGRRPDARHLLRRAGDGAAARRQGRRRPSPRVRPRRGRGDAGVAAARRRVAQGREISGVDEPRRSRHHAAARLSGARDLAERADRRDCRRGAQVLRDPVPPRSRAHAAGRGAAAQLRAQDRGRGRRLDHARLQGRGDREDPQAGRKGPRDLRSVRAASIQRSRRC